MKRVGITQRVVFHEKVKERRDTLDQSWYAFAAKVGIQLFPIPNALASPAEYVNQLQLDGLIFSGGNNVSENEQDGDESLLTTDVAIERDRTESELLHWAMTNKKTVIGICRGMQFIDTNFGGTLVDVDSSIHVAEEHEVTFSETLFSEIYGDHALCNSYHRKGMLLHDLPEEIKVAGTFRNEIEAMRHKSCSVFGIMWHPERYTPFRKEDVQLFSIIFNANQKL